MRDFYKRLRPDGTPSICWWTNLGGRRVSTGCKDLRAAQAWRRLQERQGADPRHAAAEGARLDDAIRDLYAELRRRGRAEGTLSRAKHKLGHFVRLWGADCCLGAIDARLVGEYIDARLLDPGASKGSTVKRITIRDELAFLRQLLKLARRNKLYPHPVDEVIPERWETGHEPGKRWVRPDDLPKLLEHVEPRHAAHICFFIATGARLCESYRARREDIDLKKSTVLLRGSKTKAARKELPISPFMRPLLVRTLRDAEGEDLLFRPWPNLQRDCKAACDRAGIEHATPNDFRRSFGKWHRARGFEPSLIAVLLRHTDDKLAQTTYATVEGKELGNLVRAATRLYKNGTRISKTATNRR